MCIHKAREQRKSKINTNTHSLLGEKKRDQDLFSSLILAISISSFSATNFFNMCAQACARLYNSRIDCFIKRFGLHSYSNHYRIFIAFFWPHCFFFSRGQKSTVASLILRTFVCILMWIYLRLFGFGFALGYLVAELFLSQWMRFLFFAMELEEGKRSQTKWMIDKYGVIFYFFWRIKKQPNEPSIYLI